MRSARSPLLLILLSIQAAACVGISHDLPPEPATWPLAAIDGKLKAKVEVRGGLRRLHRMDIFLALREEYANSGLFEVCDEGQRYDILARHRITFEATPDAWMWVTFACYTVSFSLLPVWMRADLNYEVTYLDDAGTQIASRTTEFRASELFGLLVLPLRAFMSSDEVAEHAIRRCCRAALADARDEIAAFIATPRDG